MTDLTAWGTVTPKILFDKRKLEISCRGNQCIIDHGITRIVAKVKDDKTIITEYLNYGRGRVSEILLKSLTYPGVIESKWCSHGS